ncbi:TetR/AcrR family transcriptional regulator [Geodermatophilus marinus]|uniref:TetR/AcrR family transcriptional regulator n=1 Tax=Geodermatophilus sp. LHW52908 TaxID=2303986 RepID=UPI0018F5454B|nr:TetR/AcrR family transcriptional regulator [Geodermatophilus sp. LHW52908]
MTESGQRTPSRDVGAALLDAAERVLVRDGLDAVTVRAVASEAGVAPMGVYNRFGSKDGLVAAVLVRGFDGLTAALTAVRSADPADRLVACGRAYRRFALGNPAHYAAMFGAAKPAAIEQLDDGGELAEHAGAAFGVLVETVTMAMAAGVLGRADPVETAQVVWSAVHGAVSLELAGVVQAADAGAAFDRLLRMVAAGLAP